MSDPAAPRLSADDIQAHFDGSPFMSFLALRVAAVDHERGELTVTVVDIDVYDEGRALVAVGRGTYSSQRG